MKNFKTILGALVLGTTLASCSITVPYAVTENPVGANQGGSESFYIGTIELNGDFGIADAAKNGKIKGGISTVDMKTTTYFPFLLYKRELLVTGSAE
jgi:hypothetical protein